MYLLSKYLLLKLYIICFSKTVLILMLRPLTQSLKNLPQYLHTHTTILQGQALSESRDYTGHSLQ